LDHVVLNLINGNDEIGFWNEGDAERKC
jgi:hypothetical protein